MHGLSTGSPADTIGAAAKFSTSVRVCHTCLTIIAMLVEYGDESIVSADEFKPFWIKVRAMWFGS